MNWFHSLAAASLPLVPRTVMRRLSARYIAGETRSKALEIGRQLQRAGYRVTYDVLGEAVQDRAAVAAAAREYRELVDELSAGGLELNVSVKPTLMGLLIDEDLCFETVADLCRAAVAQGAFVRFEMEDSSTTDGTLRVFARLRAEFGASVGCVLQSKLRRSEEDVRVLLRDTSPLNVRLVKGIYIEPEVIAFQEPGEINESYLRLTRALLAGGAFVGAATHDVALVQGFEEVLAEFPALGEGAEIQMLLGVREDVRTRLRDSGVPVRVYVPYGGQWLPYVQRRLRENPQLIGYAMRGMLRRRERLQKA